MRTGLFPLKGFQIDDGCHYDPSAFTLQFDIAYRDPFLEIMAIAHVSGWPRDGWQEQFARVHASIRQLLLELGPLHAYKFGITQCPAVRFHNEDYGYFPIDGYDKMLVAYSGPPGWCGELEARLCKEHRRCSRNSAPGGESKADPGAPEYLYIVVADLSDGITLEQNAARRSSTSRLISRRALADARAAAPWPTD
jgi:hypothetical protein